ncbi:hypothetical protein DM01DRAFT_1332381 [Hesseltinella vesiculosa]|uniref:Transcription factor domain-containing protein n=1 Tax=Hesseltinella vesiculosa TaxID=101127 RepID=A0A1X2GUW9_9FUNG|nr:hypothetical protein DM01DRAFT_1332381 [Hesseltinella vesiculosa]
MQEYKQLRSTLDQHDPTIDLAAIERQLRKLEAKLSVQANSPPPTSPPAQPVAGPSLPSSASSAVQHADPTMTLQPSGIHIYTNMTEPHHFVKLLTRGINPTLVREKADTSFSRAIEIVHGLGPAPSVDTLFPMADIHHALDDPLELAWVDRLLTSSYPRCFLVYQSVEGDRLVEYISPTYIQNLTGQNKLEHALLSKAVRAFVYRHEAVSLAHQHSHATPLSAATRPTLDDPLEKRRKAQFSDLYFQQAEELLELCFVTSSRNTIRALLHMYMYQWMMPQSQPSMPSMPPLSPQPTHQNANFKVVQYSDLALRMAQGLRIQRDTGMMINELLREDDRRLWWSTVWAHLWSCMVFDRPLLLDPMEVLEHSRPPSKRANESIEVGYCVDFCVQSVKLLAITNHIRHLLLQKTTELHLLDNLQDIDHQLQAWRGQLPESFRPETWNQTSSSTSSSSTPTPMDHHHHDFGGPNYEAKAFAAEISLLLHGQWARVKLLVYECFVTHDRSILDLLIMRNRFTVATEFVQFLAHIVQRTQPCYLLYLLTCVQPCLAALLSLATCPKTEEAIRDQAYGQLATLKTLLHQFPFFNEPAAKHWILMINNAMHNSFTTPHQLHQPPPHPTPLASATSLTHPPPPPPTQYPPFPSSLYPPAVPVLPPDPLLLYPTWPSASFDPSQHHPDHPNSQP